MSAYWGYHLSVDCGGCDHAKITDFQNVYNFTKRLVTDIDMVAYGEPIIVNFGTGNKAGFTMVQLIETSNICAHFVNENNEIYLDVFSCKTFNPENVIVLLKLFFDAQTTRTNFVSRQA